jgi:hypothetical protein
LDEIGRAVKQADQLLQQGDDVVIYTSRQLMAGVDAHASLTIG